MLFLESLLKFIENIRKTIFDIEIKEQTTMSYDQHLVETFYISKPKAEETNDISPEETEESHSQTQHERTLKKGKTVKFASAPSIKMKDDPKCERIFRMIKQQISPSAEVRLKVKSKQKNKKLSKDYQFLSQFQTFFKGFVKSSQLNQEYLRRKSRKNTKKKTTRKLTQFSDFKSESEGSKSELEVEEEENSDLFIKEKPHKLNFHQRMRKKIESKIDGIVQNVGEKKLHKVQMKDKGTSLQVNKMLLIKDKCKKAPPKLRIIRSGLPIRIAELDPKAKNSHRGLVQDQKAKKDHGFYKTLQKNCAVVLSEISNYEHTEYSSKKISRHKTPSKSRSAARSYLKETISNCVKNEQRLKKKRRSMDDEDQLKWRAKCQVIEQGYSSNLRKSRKLGGGLKVFEKYCNFVNNKWQGDQNIIKTLLDEQTQPMVEPPLYTNL